MVWPFSNERATAASDQAVCLDLKAGDCGAGQALAESNNAFVFVSVTLSRPELRDCFSFDNPALESKRQAVSSQHMWTCLRTYFIQSSTEKLYSRHTNECTAAVKQQQIIHRQLVRLEFCVGKHRIHTRLNITFPITIKYPVLALGTQTGKGRRHYDR
jgi:hypothetical protein